MHIITPRILAVALLAAAAALATEAGPAAFPQGEIRFGLPSPPTRREGAIRIATYNTLNLFDRVDDPALSGEFDDALPANQTSDDRLKGLAAAIHALDADILGLQEVESLEALTWFRDTYLADMGYTHMASRDAGYYRGVECSILSRFPIIGSKVWLHEDLTTVERTGPGWSDVPAEAREKLSFQRSPLMARIKVRDDYELAIFCLHHKAGPQFSFHREAEAARINEFIDSMRDFNGSANIIVMGDFNAAPWDKSLRLYLENGLVDSMAYRCTSNKDEECRRYKTHESDRVLDYILFSAAAYREVCEGSAFVLGTLFPGDDYDYRTDTPPAGYASDHYPVAVELVPVDAK